MKPLVIGCKEAVWGFALTGIHGVVVESETGFHRVLDESLADPDIGVLLITEDVAALDQDRVNRLMARSEHPLVVQIPGPSGPCEDRPSLREVLQKTIGVRL